MNIATQIEELNKKYKLNNANGLKNNNSTNYTTINGKIPILLSAPHAVKQVRDGKVKAEDAYTGGITEYLCKVCSCFGIIRTFNEADDPNIDNTGLGFDYKQQILNTIRQNNIKLLLDIHGCNNSHGFDFCIGTNSRKNLNGQNDILDILNIGLSYIGQTAVDDYFKASLDGNIAKYIAQHTNIPTIQLEISSDFRKDANYLEQLILSLQIIIENINKRYLSNKKELER